MEKCKYTWKHWLALTAAALLPLLFVAMGVTYVLGDGIPNFCTICSFFLLPVGAVAGCWLVIRGKKRAWVRVALCLLVLVLVMGGALYLTLWGYFEVMLADHGAEAVTSYQADESVQEEMPGADELGAYTDIAFYDYYSQFAVIFTCDADTLIVTYNQPDYHAEKAALAQRYTFETGDVPGLRCEPLCSLEGFDFAVAHLENVSYPSSMLLVGTNDATGQIAYVCFYDDDLDYIESLQDFLLIDCGWEHIF